MYFGNINDTDLNEQHGRIKDNIKTSLTDLLTNNLFHTETTTMAGKTYYKIIPLFYYDKVTTNDKDAQILDRLIICQSKADTVFNFTSPHLHKKYKIYTTYITGTDNQYYYHIRILDEWGRGIPDQTCQITSETPDQTTTTIDTGTLTRIDESSNKGDYNSKYDTPPISETLTSNQNGLIIYTTEETSITYLL